MFSSPEKNLDQFDLAPGMTVADFGSGVGHHAFGVAKKVGESGKVYAFDIQKDLVMTLAREARRMHMKNLHALWVDVERPYGTQLRDGGVDRALVINVLFQLENKEAAVQEIARVVRPGGKVLVIDWTNKNFGFGPGASAGAGALSSPEVARSLFEKNGFTFDRHISAGAHHFGMVFEKGR